jgi:hypothetical protein
MEISDIESIQELVIDVQNTYLFLKIHSSKKCFYRVQVSCDPIYTLCSFVQSVMRIQYKNI